MFRRIPQPPMNPAARAREAHDFRPGFIVALAGVILLASGFRHLTGVGTVDGGPAREVQLVRAFASGGLQYPSRIAPPPPPNLDNVADPGAALDRWAKQVAAFQPPAWKLRVNAAAQTPCPT
jgi:hypothetical protein